MTREEQIYNAGKESLQERYGCRKFCKHQGECEMCDGRISPYKLNECGVPADDYYEAFIAGAQWADQHPVNQWHDASKELPKVDKEFKYKVVLVARQDNRVHFACYSEVAGFSVNESFYGEFLINDVKYWMEIPELPKEE